MKARIVLLTLSFFSFLDLLSEEVVTPKELYRIFKKSIKQESKKKVSIGANAWLFCNDDNSFFTSDTIKMYSGNHKYVNESSIKFNCCEKMEWTFYRHNKFVQSKSQTCKEPSSSTLTKVDDWFTLDIVETSDGIFLRTSNRTIKRNFKFIDLRNDPKNKMYKVLTLLRVNN